MITEGMHKLVETVKNPDGDGRSRHGWLKMKQWCAGSTFRVRLNPVENIIELDDRTIDVSHVEIQVEPVRVTDGKGTRAGITRWKIGRIKHDDTVEIEEPFAAMFSFLQPTAEAATFDSLWAEHTEALDSRQGARALLKFLHKQGDMPLPRLRELIAKVEDDSIWDEIGECEG